MLLDSISTQLEQRSGVTCSVLFCPIFAEHTALHSRELRSSKALCLLLSSDVWSVLLGLSSGIKHHRT